MTQKGDLEDKFNDFGSMLFNYIGYLEESLESKDTIIDNLSTQLKTVQKELEEIKLNKPVRGVTPLTSQEELSESDLKNSDNLPSSVKLIDRYYDVSKLCKGITLIKKDKVDCPKCHGRLVARIIKLACYHREKIVGYIQVGSMFCGKCKLDYTYHSINDQIKAISPLKIKQLSITREPVKPIIVLDKKEIILENEGNSMYKADLNEESALKKLGYQITGTSRSERWSILVNSAIPKLGKYKVIQIIESNIRMRKGQKNGHEKYKNAITEWEHDLRKINGKL